jgi:hypothetical protein
MQFLDTVTQSLNKVDKLAAEVAVVAKESAVVEESFQESEDEFAPELLETAEAVEALALRLGDWRGGGGEEEGETKFTDPAEAAGGGDGEPADGGASAGAVAGPVGLAGQLDGILAELRRQEGVTAQAVRHAGQAQSEAAEEAVPYTMPHQYPLQLNLTMCSQCNSAPVHSRSFLLLPGLTRYKTSPPLSSTAGRHHHRYVPSLKPLKASQRNTSKLLKLSCRGNSVATV